jgi:hypothetical protein
MIDQNNCLIISRITLPPPAGPAFITVYLIYVHYSFAAEILNHKY